MSMLDQFFTPAEDGVSQSVNATTASSAITVPGQLFLIAASQPITITWGRGTTAAATPSATVGMLLPANTLIKIDAGTGTGAVNTFKVFNTAASSAVVGYGTVKS